MVRRLRNIHPGWVAGAIAVLVALWLVSGNLEESSTATNEPAAAKAPEPVSVQVRESRAESIVREADVSGWTAPVRAVDVRAETEGQVVAVEAERGERVAEGDVIVRLGLDDRKSQLAEAQAMLEQRRLQFQAARDMHEQGYQTRVDLAQARANLDAARAAVERIRTDIAETTLRAPFAGVLETRPVEMGDFVRVGDVIGRVIQQNPFIVYGDVSEEVVPYLEEGQPGSAKLTSGEVRKGRIRYVASEADEQTLTYRVELQIDNPGGRLIAGSSAQLRLPLNEVSAHAVEPAILTLNEAGVFGIKTVTDDGTVTFHEAQIVRNRDGRVWLSGLPERLRIITVGQGFVRAGDQVDAVVASDDAGAAEGAAAEAPDAPDQPAS